MLARKCVCHALLLKAGSETYLFLKSKSCGSCAARRAGLFSPLSKVSLPLLPDSASFPPSSSPIQIFRVGFIRQVWGRGGGGGGGGAGTGWLQLPGWGAVLILFGECAASALPLPTTCYLAGGVLCYMSHRRTMSMASAPPLCFAQDGKERGKKLILVTSSVHFRGFYFQMRRPAA